MNWDENEKTKIFVTISGLWSESIPLGMFMATKRYVDLRMTSGWPKLAWMQSDDLKNWEPCFPAVNSNEP